MNLMEYRAMKAQEAEQTTPPVEEQPNAQANQVSTEPVQETNPITEQGEPTPPSSEPEKHVPQTVEINGQQVPIEELTKGYMRNADYTRKTQELAAQRRQIEEARLLFDAIQANPELAEQLGYDPREAELRMTQEQLNDLLVRQEIDELSTRYADFNEQEVLQFAVDNQLESLENAYLLNKARQSNVPPQTNVQESAIDAETLKKQIREEVLRELQAQVDTSSLISGKVDNAPKGDTTPQLTEDELRIARNLRLSPEEYIKWR